jgi:hypothetical protein
VCLESTQIDSYLNLSEDRESKYYHHLWVVAVGIVGLTIPVIVPCVHHVRNVWRRDV